MESIMKRILFLSLLWGSVAFTNSQQPSLKPALAQIEAEIRQLETDAITALKKEFNRIPEFEWQETFHTIALFKNNLKKHLTDGINNNNNNTITASGSVFPHSTPFNYDLFDMYTKKCAAARGINPERILVHTNFEENDGEIAHAAIDYEYRQSLINNQWIIQGAHNFNTYVWYTNKEKWNKTNNTYKLYSYWAKEQRLNRKRFDNFANFAESFTIHSPTHSFHFIEKTIHHELTHIIEGHGIIKSHVKKLIEKYYTDFSKNHPLWLKFTKSHEYMADLMPRLLYKDIAEISYNYADFEAHPPLFVIIAQDKENCWSQTHPTTRELYPWLERIVKAHES